ncbi:MAG: hypothetical protein CMO44_07900 [Verrucomicrobiales bacterium]|nr:hypothetical protein [Verrucomicrobiales bacterium]|tara:strand:+ start:1635 stop:1877 length:243 start_codon:yes stop_codon:yes gene_type:complete
MGIKGTLSRVATIGGSVVGAGNIRAKQVAIGSASGSTDISAKSIQELSDVNASETDDGILSYNATTDKWETTTVLDGGTF